MSDREEEAERHATNLELFVDLVFVFAVTQIASSISHDLTWSGARPRATDRMAGLVAVVAVHMGRCCD